MIEQILKSKVAVLKKLGLFQSNDEVKIPFRNLIFYHNQETDVFLYDVTVNGSYKYDLRVRENEEEFTFLSLIHNLKPIGVKRSIMNIKLFKMRGVYTDIKYLEIPELTRYFFKVYDERNQNYSFFDIDQATFNGDELILGAPIKTEQFESILTNLK